METDKKSTKQSRKEPKKEPKKERETTVLEKTDKANEDLKKHVQGYFKELKETLDTTVGEKELKRRIRHQAKILVSWMIGVTESMELFL